MDCAKGETLISTESTLLSGKKNTFSDASLTVRSTLSVFYPQFKSGQWPAEGLLGL